MSEQNKNAGLNSMSQQHISVAIRHTVCLLALCVNQFKTNYYTELSTEYPKTRLTRFECYHGASLSSGYFVILPSLLLSRLQGLGLGAFVPTIALQQSSIATPTEYVIV